MRYSRVFKNCWVFEMVPPQRPRPQRSISKPPLDINKLLKLLDQWTRCDVMSRLGLDIGLANVCAIDVVEKAQEIKTLIYGTCDLVELGKQFGWGKIIGGKRDVKTGRKTGRTDKPPQGANTA